MPKGIQNSLEMAEISNKKEKNDVIRAAFPQFLRFPKYCWVLESSRDQIAALCQRTSQWVSKWLRKTQANTDTHLGIYIL